MREVNPDEVQFHENLLRISKQKKALKGPMVKHIHKYKRLTTENGKIMWKCVDACPHHFYGNEGMAGRQAICWKCEEPFTIQSGELSTLLVKPICQRCAAKRKEQRKIDADPTLRKLHREASEIEKKLKFKEIEAMLGFKESDHETN